MFINNFFKKILTITTAITISFSLLSTNSYANSSPDIQRISGSNRYDTSAKISDTVYERANNVVLVNGNEFPDGLTGGVLASIIDGPLLLSEKNILTSSIEKEISNLSAKKVYILGGTNSISSSVEKKLKDKKLDVKRIGGVNRYDTSQLVAQEIMTLNPNTITVGIANGTQFADALSSTALLAREKFPLLLTDNKTMPNETKKFLEKNKQINDILIFGGASSISIGQSELLNKEFKLATTRYQGSDRYETSYDIASRSFDSPENTILVNGNQFPDALSASTLSKKRYAPILLSSHNKINNSVMSYISKSKKIFFVGGTTSLQDKLKDDIVKYNNSSIHKVLSVESNDTLMINYFGRERKVKLIGVDFPKYFSSDEKLEAQLKKESKDFLEKLTLNKKIIISNDIMHIDNNGNFLVYMRLDDSSKMVNEIMLENGYLQAVPISPNNKYTKHFYELQEKAKSENKGFWKYLPDDNA